MQLVGRLLSPFVRRVAATMNLYGLPYEQLPLSVLDRGAEIARYNPLVRVPALVLDGGEILVDSAAILDHLDEVAGPDRALTPRSGADRRAVLRAVFLALGAVEKAVQAFYERDRRPTEKVWPEQLAKLTEQARGGFAALEAMAPSPWLCLGRMTQADVTTAVALDFAHLTLPDLAAGRYPKLEALRERMNAIPAFRDTQFKG